MEICERREHKITDIAVMNVQRSYNLFNKNPRLDLEDKSPVNLTPEEKKLYSSLQNPMKVVDLLACKCPECGSNHKEKHRDGNITCRDCGLVLYTLYPYTAGIRLNIPTCDLYDTH
ncbi:MAG TPA: hypothetical protein PKU94_07835 [Candidatus Hydrothermia bacterium]|nr:hypothetical protein [Candidatus Hydrothermia bacterium]